jgi:hypothetical protein
VRARAPCLLVAFALAGCGGDRTRSPSCGLAQIAGPTLIQQQLTKAPYVLTDAPRGLPSVLPARVVGMQQQGEVLVEYERERLVMGYQKTEFPITATYALLVVDDSTQRAQGVLIYESEPPKSYPRLGTVTGGLGGAERIVPLFGVRVDWSSVNNPRCPLLGAAAPATR